MDIIEKVNQTRYTLKEILSDEWETSIIPDYTNYEIERIYSNSNNPLIQFRGKITSAGFKKTKSVSDSSTALFMPFENPKFSLGI